VGAGFTGGNLWAFRNWMLWNEEIFIADLACIISPIFLTLFKMIHPRTRISKNLWRFSTSWSIKSKIYHSIPYRF
jgi:hypothetical protein